MDLKKFIGMIFITALIIAFLVWIASIIFSFSYSEWGFFIGIGLTIVILFLNSSGGTTMGNYEASLSMWKIQKDEDLKVNVGVVFYGSVLYSINSFILMVFTYFLRAFYALPLSHPITSTHHTFVFALLHINEHKVAFDVGPRVQVTLEYKKGAFLSSLNVPQRYDVRYAELDRSPFSLYNFQTNFELIWNQWVLFHIDL